MKTIKSILIAATLICATAVSAQEAQAPKHEFKVAIGDSVMIKRECQKYCTGETPSVWVWDKVHTVRQLGTKRFPDGVLLMNIYSWMCEDCLVPVNGQSAEKAEQAKKEQADQKKAYEQAVKERKEAQAAAEKAKAEEAKAAQEAKAAEAATAAAAAKAAESAKAADEAKKAEPAKAAEAAKAEEAKKAAEAKKAEQAKAAEAAKAAEPAKAAEAAKDEKPGKAETVKHELAKGDSIRSKQDFKNNYDRFTIGVRGGVASQLHQPVAGVNAKWGIGGDALLDIQYAHYWASDARKVDLGLIVGLSVGYAQGSFSSAVDTTFSKGDLKYTIKTAQQIKETDHQVQLEIPLMFSLIHENGLFFNVGPRFMLPVYTPLSQNIDKNAVSIDAFDAESGVTLHNNPVTGQYNNQAVQGGNDLQWKINIMLTAELGYEFLLKSGNSLGLGVYADYSVYNSRKVLNAAKHASLIDIVNPPSSGSYANVGVFSATDSYAGRVGYFDAGIKVAYHFNWPKKKVAHEARLF